MKKIFTLLAFVLFVVSGSATLAQVTITAEDIGRPGTVIIYNNDTSFTDTSSFAQTGAQAIWNFATLLNSFEDTVSFENLGGVGNFSTANLAVKSGNAYQYFLNQETGLVLQGLNLGSNTGMAIDSMAVRLDPPLTFLQFPATLNSSYTSTAAGRITIPYDTSIVVDGQTYAVDSIRFNVIMDQQSNIDASGELLLPQDTMEVIRQKVMQETRLVVEVRAVIVFNGMPIVAWVEVPMAGLGTMRNYFYRYWGDFKNFPVLEISMDSSRNVIGTRYQKESFYLLSSKTNIQKSAVKIYPSPATDFINVEIADNNAAATLELFDLQGRVVKKLVLNQTATKANIANLLSGTYFYTIRSNKGDLLAKGSLVKQ